MASDTRAGQDFQMLVVADVIPSPDNPRHVRQEAKDRELAESVRDVGVLQPVLVRPHPTEAGKWDLRAGSRRLEAAKGAGLERIPAIVREMTDDEALRITVIENVQREDLTPFEEADAVLVLKSKGWSIETIAAQLGKSPVWVARRASLNSLTEGWKAAVLREEPAPKAEPTLEEKREKVLALLREDDPEDTGDYEDAEIEDFYADMSAEEDDTPASRVADWPVGHLELVARMPAEVQAELLAHWWRDVPTLKELRAALDRHMRNLSGAPWTLDAALAGKPPCAECTSRSDRQPLLFEDLAVKENSGHCLVPSCWNAKVKAILKTRAKELIAEHGADGVLFVKNGYDVEPPVRGKVVSHYEVTQVKKGHRGAKACLWLDGVEAGHWFWGVDPAFGSTRHTAGRVKGPTPLKERRKQLERRRVAWIISEVLLPAIKDWALPEMPRLLAYAVTFGTKHRHDSPGDYYAQLPSSGRQDPWKHLVKWNEAGQKGCEEGLWQSVQEVFAGRLHYSGMAFVPVDDAKAIAKQLGFAWSNLQSVAATSLPEPRAWAKLNEDGTPKEQLPTTKNAKNAKDTKAGDGKAVSRKGAKGAKDGKEAGGLKAKGKKKPKRGVCRVCGCTHTTPCTTPTGPCAWTDETQTLCTACEGKEA